MSRPLVAIALLGAIVIGCDALDVPSPEVLCTAIGCDSQVVFELNVDLEAGELYEIQACLDQACEAATVEIPLHGVGVSDSIVVDVGTDIVTLVLPEGDYGGSHSASLAIAGEGLGAIRLETETEFERSQPNGRNCPPICWQAIVRA